MSRIAPKASNSAVMLPLLRAALACAVIICVLAGCAAKPELMPTPSLYTRQDSNPFAEVPPALQNNRVEVLYMTDRVRESDAPDQNRYGFKRSRAVAYGISEVQFGQDVSWEELVKASRERKRSVNLDISVTKTMELGRFPPTPRTLIELPDPATQPSSSRQTHDEEYALSVEHAQKVLSAQLAQSAVKDVYIFVHGYNNTFDDAVTTIAQLWHFFGRNGVPIAYSWPAGSTGLLRGYTYDRESSEFTVYHFKQMLLRIAENPEVRKVHVIAHSRGTDVASSALRELHLEISGSGKTTREVLKLGTFVLAAPDLDLDVVIQRLVTLRLGRVPEHFALYVCANDKALGISNWLFSGGGRLGQLRSDIFTPEELVAMRSSRTVQIIDARVSDAGSAGHNYFHSNPAVSSDLILLMRYQLPPGAENGRPLRIDPKGFWYIDDDYPDESKDKGRDSR